MELKLAENIRAFRKQRKMTQERLAEVLGVSVGAVYKWESGLSQPELSLIVEMADFFDTSVDVLLGCPLRDHRLDAALERMGACCRTLDPEALAEAGKLLGKYPHSFRVVYACASVHLVFGMAGGQPEQLRRALELLEQARGLLPQNDDPHVNDATICGGLSCAYLLLGEREKALELLKRNNANQTFSADIGNVLAVFMDRPEEAVPFLAEGLVNGIITLINAIFGYLFVFRARRDWESALAIATWGNDLLPGLKTGCAPSFMDKVQAEMLLMLAYARAKAGMREFSLESLSKAAQCAARFDSTPDYSFRTMLFVDDPEPSAIFDALGATASRSIGRILELLGDEAFSAQWKEVSEHE